MSTPFVSDALRPRIEPLLPTHHSPGPKSGRPPVNDRATLAGILFVLKPGIPREMFPREMHCGCGMTRWRRLRGWQASGVWDNLLTVLPTKLQSAGKLVWSRSAVDSSRMWAVGGAEATVPNPTDRTRGGTKDHIIVDGHGVRLAMTITRANVPDLPKLLPLIVRTPQVRGKPGHTKSRPRRLYADRAYDAELARHNLGWLGIEPPFFARRGTQHGSGIRHFRWVVERTRS